MLKHILSCAAILFPILLCFGTENVEIFLPQGSPLFHTTKISGPPDAFVPQDTLAAVHETSTGNFKLGALDKDTRILKITYPGSARAYWTFSDIRLQVDPDTKKVSFEFLPYAIPMAAGILCIALAIGTLFLCIRGKGNRFQDYLPFGFIVLLQYGILLYLIGITANIMLFAYDEVYYHAIAKDIAHMDFTGPWRYTIGLPVLYLPIVMFCGDSFHAARLPLTVFNAFFAMPLLLCMAYQAIRKISSARAALWMILLWIVMILFYHHRYYYIGDHTALETYMMKSFPRLPALSFSYSYLELLVLLGYNAVSDTMSCTLVFCCIAASLCMKPTTRNLALFSALYALTCLVRINNVIFIPLLAFSLYLRYAENLRNPRQWIRFLLTGAIPFLLVFSVQLAINAIQLGSPFTLPYVLHQKPDMMKGFTMKTLPFGIRFLGINNFAYFVIGTLSLFFIADRKSRVILSLWTLPLTIFFFGYPEVFNNGTRFILPVYAGFVAAVVLADIWKGVFSEKIRCAAVLLAGVFLTAPAGTERMEQYLPWDWGSCGMTPHTAFRIQIAVIAVSIIILLSFLVDFRRANERFERRRILSVMLYLALFLLFFHWGNPYAVAVLMLCAFLRACYDAVILIREKIRTVPAECVSEDAEST